MEDNFSADWDRRVGGGGVGNGFGMVQCITSIVHFISIIITSAPP